jgi:hypothetical protein
MPEVARYSDGPTFSGCLNCRCPPFDFTSYQPSDSSIRMTSRTFTGMPGFYLGAQRLRSRDDATKPEAEPCQLRRPLWPEFVCFGARRPFQARTPSPAEADNSGPRFPSRPDLSVMSSYCFRTSHVSRLITDRVRPQRGARGTPALRGSAGGAAASGGWWWRDRDDVVFRSRVP